MGISVPVPKFEIGKHPDLPPPSGSVGAWAWLRNNLFSSITNCVLTIFAVWILFGFFSAVIDWFIISAIWVGTDARACRTTDGNFFDGQCWPFVWVWFKEMMIGRYPDGEEWRLVATSIFVTFWTRTALVESAFC